MRTGERAPHSSLNGRSRVLLALTLPAFLVGACSTTIRSSPTAVPTRQSGPTIVSLTFDDGNADNFAAAGVLAQSGLHGTFYIPSGLIGTPNHMSWTQLSSLQQQGQEIGGHTVDHVNVRGLASAELKHEICDDRQNLQAHGFQPSSFAFPFGSYDEAAKAMVAQCGYTDARTVRDGPDQLPPVDAFALRAMPYIVNDTDFTKLQRYVNDTRKTGGGWVILIVHHVCNDCDYYSIQPDLFQRLATWLAGQQSSGNIMVKTISQVLPPGTP